MDERKKDKDSQRLVARGTKAPDGQASPVTLLTIALAGGIGYFAWRFWNKWQEGSAKREPASTAGSSSVAEATSPKSKNGGSSFCFDKQPQTSGSASTSGRTPAPPPNNRQSRSRQEKPKSQKQLRKEAKEAKKAAKEQATRDAANAQ
ncbi:hypothetical protein Agub_g11140, partial [Astrephomene gubernaculifera]